jgi:hypothetical protein
MSQNIVSCYYVEAERFNYYANRVCQDCPVSFKPRLYHYVRDMWQKVYLN